jgi:hypothetical protein
VPVPAFALLLAQFLVPPDSRAADLTRRVLTRSPEDKIMRCAIQPEPPRLGFSFMHWAGFRAGIPIRQFGEIPKTLEFVTAIEITPKGGKPSYLVERFSVQPPPADTLPARNAEIFYNGGYHLGPGEYRIRAYLGSGDNRLCRKEWTAKVRQQKVPLKLEANQVTSVGGERWKGLTPATPPRRITVILDASPLFPRRNAVRLSSYDRSILLTSLTSLLDNSGATAATVIAVDPRNRNIIFSASDFGPRDLRRLARSISEVNLGIVSLKTLQGPGAVKFMEMVLSSLDDNAAKSGDLVFLGSAWSWFGKPTPKIKELAANLPPMHYLALTRVPGKLDNLIAGVVRSNGGELRQIFTPADLAKGIAKVNQ